MNSLKIIEDLIEIEKKLPIGWSLGIDYSKKYISVSLWNKSLPFENAHVCVIADDTFNYEKIIMARLEQELVGYDEALEEKKQKLINQLKALED
jgi:hypothetical protein